MFVARPVVGMALGLLMPASPGHDRCDTQLETEKDDINGSRELRNLQRAWLGSGMGGV
jgi:hypothetical protein